MAHWLKGSDEKVMCPSLSIASRGAYEGQPCPLIPAYRQARIHDEKNFPKNFAENAYGALIFIDNLTDVVFHFSFCISGNIYH